jgi:hypothetical protein
MKALKPVQNWLPGFSTMYRYTKFDTVGELMGAELGSLFRRKSSEVRRSRLLRFSSCYKVIYTNKIDSSSNKKML